MRPILVVNPNTTAAVSDLLAAQGTPVVPGVPVRVRTARFGAPYIGCEASYAIAAHAVLDAWSAEAAAAPPAAVLVGCFGDPGLFALREAGVAATGLASAAAAEAARHGPFAIVTGGAKWEPMLRRLMQALEFDAALAGIHTLEASGLQLARDPAGAQVLLARACREAAVRFGARSVVLGGAALGGIAQRIQGQVDVPVIDSVAAGFRHVAQLAAESPQDEPTRREEIAGWLATL
jgi:Asp/Glu/hydantoin racemase